MNLLESMAKTTALVSGSIQQQIVYEHRKKGAVADVENISATAVSLQNYRYNDNTIESAKRFILSKRVSSGVMCDFLDSKPKRNDSIMELDGTRWYVLEVSQRDIEMDILCSLSSFTATTSKARF